MKSRHDQKVLADNHEFDSAETAKAWAKFLANRSTPSLPVTGVRRIIYKSWERSTQTGIRAEQLAAPTLEKTMLNEKQQFYQAEMRRATQSCLHRMSEMLAGTEAMLILTDRDGVILETVGDNSTLNKGGKINLSVGGVWSESAAGTNGIGTALWMDKPVFVHGEEHFCEGMKAWSCAAAPIHDPVDQSVIGVINLSGLSSIFQRHNPAFAATLARDIELSLQQSISQLNFELLEWVVGQRPRRAFSGSDGLAIINNFGRLIFDRPSPESMATPLASERLGKPFLDLSGVISEEAIIAALPSRFTCKEVQLIEINGTVKGASLILQDESDSSGRKQSAKRMPLPGVELANTGLKIIGRSDAILAALETAYSLFDTTAPTLIQGETGVGKQLFARLVYAGHAPYKHQPFTFINCAALTRELLESGFTQSNAAGSDRSSSMSENDVKFLVFDEIGELPVELQPVLLRLLENIAAETDDAPPETCPVRLLSLTNRRLMAEVAADRFRQDLYYRLGAVVLEIPPLRDRGEDILLIFEHYNRLLSIQSGRAPLVLSADVQDAMLAHDWPGNVRELRNTVAALHFKGKTRAVKVSDLPFTQDRQKAGGSPIRSHLIAPKISGLASLKDTELATIECALTAHNGNLSKTAIALGISRPTLYRKMQQYSICIKDGAICR